MVSLDGAALLDRRLAVPLVEDDADATASVVRMWSRIRSAAHRPAVGDVVGPVVGGGQLGHVLALVPALGDLLAAPTGEEALAEGADLSAGVVDVVLAAHPVQPQRASTRPRASP